ncbi:enoyl-CoA hydratase [Alphaproteobacteria bacterium]|nr:enoyl-CoA hydratase [Alphaproteobacteria bacterium]
MNELVTVSIENEVALVTLNRPEAMNALSAALRSQLATVVNDLEANPNVRVMVLTGAGERAFTAGLDLKEMGEAGSGGPALAIDADDPVVSLSRFTGPIIGAINGVAITGGFELALACDVIIGSTNARFADTHARVGIVPGWGLSQKLSRLIGMSRAKELSLTGNFIDAETACAWGILSRVVPADKLVSTAMSLADDMCSCDPETLRAYKKLIDDGFGHSFADGMALELTVSKQRNSQVSADEVEARREAIRARGQQQKAGDKA